MYTHLPRMHSVCMYVCVCVVLPHTDHTLTTGRFQGRCVFKNHTISKLFLSGTYTYTNGLYLPFKTYEIHDRFEQDNLCKMTHRFVMQPDSPIPVRTNDDINGYHPANRSVVAIFVDRRCFSAGAATFRDIEPNLALIRQSEILFHPPAVLRMLNMFQHIVAYSSLGVDYEVIEKEKKASLGTYAKDCAIQEDEDAAPFNPDKPPKKKQRKISMAFPLAESSYFEHPDTGKITQRVQQYIQFRRNERNELLGFIYIFHAIDKRFSFDRALETLFLIETMRRNAIKKPPPTEMEKLGIFLYANRQSWLTDVVGTYAGNHFVGTDLYAEALKDHLALGTAATCKVFSLKRAMEWVSLCYPEIPFTPPSRWFRAKRPSKKVTIAQRNDAVDEETIGQSGGEENDNNDDDDDSNDSKADAYEEIDSDDENQDEIDEEIKIESCHSVQLRFGDGAAFIDPNVVHPARFFRVSFMDLGRPMDIPKNERQYRLFMNDLQRSLDADAYRINATELLKKRVAEVKLDCAGNLSAFAKWIRSPDTMHLYVSSLSSHVDCPVSRLAFQWYEESRRKCKPGHFTLVVPQTRYYSKKMTYLANIMCQEAAQMDAFALILTLHQELSTMAKASLMACNISGSSELREHYLMLGTAESGKSHLLNMLYAMSLPGAAEFLSWISSKGATSNVNHNGEVCLMDEMMSGFAENDMKENLSNWKELLTKGKLKTKHLVMNRDTGERTEVDTTSDWKTQFMVGTNDPASKIHRPILTRFNLLYISLRQRYDKDVTTLNYMVRNSPEAQKAYQNYLEKWHRIHFLMINYWHFLEIGAIEAIDTRIPVLLMPVVTSVIRKEGYDVDPRAQDRLMLHTCSVNLYEAGNRLCHTEDHFPAGTEFEFYHALELQKHLLCTREQFWVALGELFYTIVNPFIDLVLEAMYALITEQQEGDNQHPIVYEGDKKQPKVDYNYFILNVSHSMCKSHEIFNITAERIEKHIRQTTKERLSVNNVKDALLAIYQLKVDSKYSYIAPDPSDDTPQSVPKSGPRSKNAFANIPDTKLSSMRNQEEENAVWELSESSSEEEKEDEDEDDETDKDVKPKTKNNTKEDYDAIEDLRRVGRRGGVKKLDVLSEMGNGTRYGLIISREFIRSRIPFGQKKIIPSMTAGALLERCIEATTTVSLDTPDKVIPESEKEGWEGKQIVYGVTDRKPEVDESRPQHYRTLHMDQVKGTFKEKRTMLTQLASDANYRYQIGKSDTTESILQSQLASIKELNIPKGKKIAVAIRDDWAKNHSYLTTPMNDKPRTVKIYYSGCYPPLETHADDEKWAKEIEGMELDGEEEKPLDVVDDDDDDEMNGAKKQHPKTKKFKSSHKQKPSSEPIESIIETVKHQMQKKKPRLTINEDVVESRPKKQKIIKVYEEYNVI